MKLAWALLLACSTAFGAAFNNGSFETNNNCDAPRGSWRNLATGSTCVTGWVVSLGNVDYSNFLWVASQGTHSLELNGETAGGISQTFATTPGHTYRVTFDLAGNIAALPVVKTLTVSAAGSSQGYSFDSAGKSYDNMGWTTKAFTFISDGSGSTTLQFLSTTAGSRAGPVIDNVTVTDLGDSGTIRYTVSGSVRTAAAQGIPGVALSGLPGGPVTDADGSYTGTVDPGWSGTATPFKPGFTFTPPSVAYAIVNSNQTQDYIATPVVSLLTNGSFETNNNCDAPRGSWRNLATSSTCVTGWVVSLGNVDYSNFLWVASHGTHSLELNGETAGGISQTFATIPGHTYRVTFDLAGNIAALPVVKTLAVSAAGSSQAYSFDSTGKSYENMGWTTRTFTFTSDGSGSTTLQFLSTTAGSRAGPVIDNVTVTDLGLSHTPSADEVTPAAGTGASQTFTFTFSDPDGWQDLGVVNVLINFWLDGRNSCYVAYSRPLGVLYLVNDPGTGLLPDLVLGSGGSSSNSQCTVYGTGSSASGSGNTLTLTLNMSFAAGYTGSKVVYMAARDAAEHNSGWQRMGAWKVPGGVATSPAVAGMSPPRGGGGGPATFTFQFSDTDGYADLGVLNVLVNDWLDGRNACYIAYSQTYGVLYLVNDAGTALSAPLTLGSGGSVSNSQCTIYGTGSSASGTGSTLTLTLNMSFAPAFAGNRAFYLAARDAVEHNSGWQAYGTWTVP